MREMTARAYILRRALLLVLVLFSASLLTFALITFVPGDPAVIILTERNRGEPPSPESIRDLREELGLDHPLPLRYGRWLGSALSGDFGYSFRSGQPVAAELAPRFLNTLVLAAVAMSLVVSLSLLGGLGAAASPGGLRDGVTLVASSAVAATPSFVLGLFLVLLLSVTLGLFPVAGSETPAHFVLPALTLGLAGAAIPCRVLYRHVLRNALIPFVTLLALAIRGILAGAPLVETVFGFRGIGTYLVESATYRDIPALQACILLLVVVTVVANLATDLAYLVLDPRIRLG
ncbi:MAG: ABC transporter permease [Planctomycetota bacterium]